MSIVYFSLVDWTPAPRTLEAKSRSPIAATKPTSTGIGDGGIDSSVEGETSLVTTEKRTVNLTPPSRFEQNPLDSLLHICSLFCFFIQLYYWSTASTGLSW